MYPTCKHVCMWPPMPACMYACLTASMRACASTRVRVRVCVPRCDESPHHLNAETSKRNREHRF